VAVPGDVAAIDQGRRNPDGESGRSPQTRSYFSQGQGTASFDQSDNHKVQPTKGRNVVA
jgi:hypothetical protein